MNYQIIARKYRPKNFSEVIGQGKIVTILQNALKKNRVGQAYLFSGPRGVGKTTSARILVKYLNCESDGEILPCNQCRSCSEINRGTSLDYLEIDGASNRGIDQIRALNEQISFASPTGKYRVFVIDEVHMLTNEAFNALLKSLEEPPAKIIFILCTTESYRIPLTIRSRCQQLFFTNVDVRLIEKHLESILKQENLPFVPHSLRELAKKSEGSIRDAENLLEKVIAFNEEKGITTALVQEVLGDTPTDKKYLFFSYLSSQNLKENFILVSQLTADGYNLSEFFYSLIDILSDLVYYKSGIRDSETLGLTAEETEQLKGLEKLFTLNEIYTLSDILFEFIRSLKNTTHQGTMVQYLLIKLHRYKNLITPGELKENILKLSRYTLPDETLDIPLSQVSPKSVEREEVIPIPIPSRTKSTPQPESEEQEKIAEQTQLPSQESEPSHKPPAPENPPQASSNPQASTTSPPANSPWEEEDYKNFLQILKEADHGLFRMAAAFRFLKMEGEQWERLILENINNLSSDRVDSFREQLEEYLNLPAHHTHPLLEKLMSPPKRLQVTIQESIVKSNLEKIKKIFSLEE